MPSFFARSWRQYSPQIPNLLGAKSRILVWCDCPYWAPSTHLRCYRRSIVLSNDNVTEGAMSSDDKMSIEERRKYLRRIKKRYTQATRKERGQLLDEMEAVTELHRKSLIQLMKDSYRAPLTKRHVPQQEKRKPYCVLGPLRADLAAEALCVPSA